MATSYIKPEYIQSALTGKCAVIPAPNSGNAFLSLSMAKSEPDKTLEEINRLQDIQKTNAPDSKEWKKASESLKPLFEKMAKTKTGDK